MSDDIKNIHSWLSVINENLDKIEERISELEKNYVKLDNKYYKLVIENRNDITELKMSLESQYIEHSNKYNIGFGNLTKEIAELKESFHSLWDSHYNFTVVRLNRTDKVLRELFEILHYSETPIKELIASSNRLLEKLDVGSARQTERPPLGILANMITEKKEVPHCGMCIYFKGKDNCSKLPWKSLSEECWCTSFKRKASGGEKESVITDGIPAKESSIEMRTADHSKPPEHSTSYLRKAMVNMGDCTKYLKSLGNIGHLEWCVGCLQQFQKELISEFLKDLNEHEDTIDLRKKWEERLK